MNSPSKSAESSDWRKKSAGGASLPFFRSNKYHGGNSSDDDWRKAKAAAVSSGDGHGASASPSSTINPKSNVVLKNQVMMKAAKVFHHGAVLSVNHEKCFGFLAPLEGAKSASTDTVYFQVPPCAGDPMSSTATLTGGLCLIPGDIIEYELSTNKFNSHESSPAVSRRAHFARLRECKPRNVTQLESYVESLVTAANQHPEIVLRDITKCSVGFKLALDDRNPSNELLRRTLQLCHILSSSKQRARGLSGGLYHSRLKQLYALFCGSQFLTSEHGVRKRGFQRDDSVSHELLQGFLIQLLEFLPSQLPTMWPLLKRIGESIGSDAVFVLVDDLAQLLPPLPRDEVNVFLEKAIEALNIHSDEGPESFFRKVLGVLAGGSSGDDELSGLLRLPPWSQLPLLPTMDEVRALKRRNTRATLPVVKQTGPYNSPEEYIDTYLRLLREDCFAGLLQGIHALRQGRVDDCEMKLWLNVSVCGVHFNYHASPGVTLAVTLPKMKVAAASKLPMGGSLVCFFDESGGFESPTWGVVSRCEEDTDNKTCICFVNIVVGIGAESGAETGESDSWCVQCARLMDGENIVMAESPTYYKAFQPVLTALQSTHPEDVPFREELVSVAWPMEPAPEYLKRTSCVTPTLDWSGIFHAEDANNAGWFQRLYRKRGGVGAEDYEPGGEFEIREGVGALGSLAERGYKTSFDPSQLKAVELALHNRLSIIQGPPGTGKTYVGVKILQLLLSASTFPEGSPVFVITLKNHALDQFLERCLTFEERIVRVGGRSKSPKLDEYNLHNKMTKNDEFRVDYAANMQSLSTLKEEIKEAFDIVNRSLSNFDSRMILEHAPELHLNYFLERGVVHRARLEACARRLPDGLTLVEAIRGRMSGDVDPALVTDVLDFRKRLVAEMERWMPKPEVLQTALAFLSLKQPGFETSCRILLQQRDHVVSSNEESKPVHEEKDESRKEEEERRTAYERLRQDVNLESDAESRSKTSNQWLLGSNFMRFSKEKDHIRRASTTTYHRLNLNNIGSQFDWLAHENPYDLLAEHRAILVYKYWQESVNGACERLTRIKAEYDDLLQKQEQIGERRMLAVLQNARIIGMTTTGAAIQRSVVKQLAPAVVLVEEAAEILEPQVLASLNSKLQHLILIGDHHQLRPQVESYDLERWHGFGVSMFERLVEHNNLPYQALGLQCRMREEFVPMLLPIYPFLKSHTALVSGRRNAAPTCMVKTMYFWSHPHRETSRRSFVNQEEARMVVALARWIASEIPNPESLTILAAYNGQVTLIRTLIAKYPELEEVEVRSIDSFQGAESEIVIVSLVRSNDEGNIGHLSMRNRLCVAASRARCGVYFVGNHTTLAQKSDHWRTLITYFEGQNALDSSIPLCCPRHPGRSPFALSSIIAASQFAPCDVCDYRCRKVLDCGHECTHTCHPGAHSQCKEPVVLTFRSGHSQTKLCHQVEEELFCHRKVIHKFPNCEHSTEKECWKMTGMKKLHLKCQVVCGKELKCGHMCKLTCSKSCCHSAPCVDCQEIEKGKERIKLQFLIKAIANKQKELDEDISKLKAKGDEGIVVKQVHPDDDTAQSYFMAKDRVEKYTQPDCKTMVVVTKVQRIENLTLQRKFLDAQRELVDPLEIPAWLFYGGSDDLLDQVVNKGFRAARAKAHHFDVYSSSIAQKHGNHNLLLCEVHLGKTWRRPSLESPDEKLDGRKLSKKGYDSVTLVGGQENEEESRPSAHVVFNPEQAIPRFIVSYKLVNLQANESVERFGEEQASRNGGVCRIPLLPCLHFQGLTPEECHFRMAESQFNRMSRNRKMKVTKVEFIKNVDLEKRFERKKEEFKTSNVTVEQRFVFHGTDSDAIDKIVSEGFKIGGTEGVARKFGDAFGPGVYTASNPDTSVKYCQGSDMMLLSIAIPGELRRHHSIGRPEDVLVIKDVSQLFPRYVVHYTP